MATALPLSPTEAGGVICANAGELASSKALIQVAAGNDLMTNLDILAGGANKHICLVGLNPRRVQPFGFAVSGSRMMWEGCCGRC